MEDMKMNKSVAIGIFVLVVAILVYITINHTSTETPVAPTDTAALSLQGTMDTNTGTPTDVQGSNTEGVNIAVLREGSGAQTKTGDTVALNYTGSFVDGTVFDSNIDPKFGHVEALAFTIGEGKVIPGLEIGVTGMKVGEKRKLEIESDLGYGPNDYGPIPGGSKLIFEVELLAIKP